MDSELEKLLYDTIASQPPLSSKGYGAETKHILCTNLARAIAKVLKHNNYRQVVWHIVERPPLVISGED